MTTRSSDALLRLPRMPGRDDRLALSGAARSDSPGACHKGGGAPAPAWPTPRSLDAESTRVFPKGPRPEAAFVPDLRTCPPDILSSATGAEDHERDGGGSSLSAPSGRGESPDRAVRGRRAGKATSAPVDLHSALGAAFLPLAGGLLLARGTQHRLHVFITSPPPPLSPHPPHPHQATPCPQVAYLCRRGLADGVITEDSDVLVYSALCSPHFPVLYKWDSTGHVQELHLNFKAFSESEGTARRPSADGPLTCSEAAG